MKELCHVCGKEKKPYVVFMKKDDLFLIRYMESRVKGPICEPCFRYFSLTGEYNEPTDRELEVAADAMKFADMMLKWWEKNEKITFDSDNKRCWEGKSSIARWYRGEVI